MREGKDLVHPIGNIDMLCVNRDGNLVIVLLKTGMGDTMDNRCITEHDLKQLEFQATLFDAVARIIGLTIGISELAVIFWNNEAENNLASEGSSSYCKLDRNPEILVNGNDPKLDIFHSMRISK